MNRYAVLAIFVVVMMIAFGAMHTSLMDAKKAKMAKKTKASVKQEKVVEKVAEKQEKEERSSEDYFQQKYEIYDEEAPVDAPSVSRRPEVSESEKIDSTPKPLSDKPVVRQDDKEKVRPAKKEGKLDKLFAKKKEETKSDKPVDTGVGNAYGCKKLLNGKVEIPCHSEFDGLGLCYKEILTVAKEDSVSENLRNHISDNKVYREIMGASEDGEKVSWGMANRLCRDIDMYLPTEAQLQMIHKTQGTGCGVPVYPEVYWGELINDNTFSYCDMATGQCNRIDAKNPESKTVLNRVRCVRNERVEN